MRSDPLSATFMALADPTRRAILAGLASGKTSIKEISEPFQISAPAISKHLKVLEQAGLIVRDRHAQWRPAHLKTEPLQEASAWMDQYRQLWEDSFDRLDDFLRRQNQPGETL